MFFRRRRPGLLVLSILLALAACGGSDGPSDGNSPMDPDPPADPDDPEFPVDPDSDFECEREGYPCAWSDVEPQVFDRSDSLADDALQRLEGGESTASVVASLEAEDDVVDVMADEDAIRFRVEAGRPYWVLGPGGLATAGFDAPRPASGPPPPGTPGSSYAPSRAVVGDQPRSKRALVLSPYQYEFGSYDDAASVAALLGSARGYEGNVDLFVNSSSEAQVQQSHFAGWASYEVVHISSHGQQLCEGGECQTVIAAGATSRELLLGNGEEGVDAIKIRYGEQSSGPGQDYFRRTYPNGLPDTIVYISACKTMEGTDLAEMLAGDGGAYVGWDETVDADDAKAASEGFFRELIERGVTTADAYESLRDGGLGIDPAEGDEAEAELQLYDGGTDLRIREIAWLHNPLSEDELPTEMPYPVVGQPEDGEPDEIPFRIEVDGVNGDPSGFTVHVRVNGFSGDPVALEEGEAVDGEGNRWRVEGEVPVTFDAQQGQTVDLDVRVDLPEGQQSEWDEETELGNPALRFTSEFESEAYSDDFVRIFSEVEAEEFNLAFDRDLEALTGEGTLSYRQFVVETSGPCSLTTSTGDGRLVVVDAQFSTSETQPVVLENLELQIPPEISETITIDCPSAPPSSFDPIHWFAGFFAFHGGFPECGFPSEINQAGTALLIEDWQGGSGEVLAQKEYERSCSPDEPTFTELTTLELVDPTD